MGDKWWMGRRYIYIYIYVYFPWKNLGKPTPRTKGEGGEREVQ